MSITTALKKLAKNVFGVDASGSNIDEVLDDMASKVTPGSGGGDGSGGGSITIVHTVKEDGVLRLDKTYRELSDSMNDGAIIFLQYVANDTFIYLYHLSMTHRNSNGVSVDFFRMTNNAGSSDTANVIEFTAPTEDDYPYMKTETPK